MKRMVIKLFSFLNKHILKCSYIEVKYNILKSKIPIPVNKHEKYKNTNIQFKR
jgi:hypothetical protein